MRKLSTFCCVLAVCFSSFMVKTCFALNSSQNGNNRSVCATASDTECKDGTLLPVWLPNENLSKGDRVGRAFVYMIALIYMFIGISIISDRFMAAIEVITSQEKEIIIKMKNGEKQIVSVRIWNETVSNLTLMALGSSAPEILLSVIEVIGKKFKAGDLGPGTIVGSAAFNLFIIIAVCVQVVPVNEVRRIKHLRVFFITASWSIFAYIWLYLIIAYFSPNKIEVWEAVLTFSFFPLTVLTAYVADTKVFFKRFLNKKYVGGGIKALSKLDLEMQNPPYPYSMADENFTNGDDISEFEKHRLEYINMLKAIRKKNPNADPSELEEIAQLEILKNGPKSRAFYRMQATRQLTGSGNVIKKTKLERKFSFKQPVPLKEDVEFDDEIQRIFFDPGHYTVMENIGTFKITVSRKGANLNNVVKVDYKTVDGSATAGDDYESASGTLIFYPEELHQQFSIAIMDDDIFEEDEYFEIHLDNIRVENIYGNCLSDIQITLVDPAVATVMILDDDHGGVFHFENPKEEINEAVGEAYIKVIRSSGARGVVRIPYHTIEGTAYGGGKDYKDAEGYLEFDNDEVEKYIKVSIIDDNEYEKNEYFYIQIGDPILMKKSESQGESKSELEEKGAPRLGEIVKIKVFITESVEFKNTVNKLLRKANLSIVVGTSSWKEQFMEAITVSSGDNHDGEVDQDAQEKLPTLTDYVMHFLTIFWKILFAFVPPTDYFNGWLCFWFSIFMIGILTAIVGDLASHFGCTVGLTDAVTSITFVAIGTSLPDTFASKTAAISDNYADGSIGNVAGSNAVNVFLGIGIAWSIAAIYWYSKGEAFIVATGSLGFSVTLFCVLAVFAIIILLLRRRPLIGGELGGNPKYKLPTTLLFIGFWFVYVLLSSLENYCIIKGF